MNDVEIDLLQLTSLIVINHGLDMITKMDLIARMDMLLDPRPIGLLLVMAVLFILRYRLPL